MELLPGPYEILELGDRESTTLKIEKWELGETVIHPKFQAGEKRIRALRVWVPKEIKLLFPYYWDITSQTLIAQLMPALEVPGWEAKKYKITKYGIAPKARFSLEVI